jgi:hypothetical protein
MAGESDGPDGAAARLEAALERIAAAAARRASAPPAAHAVAPPAAAPSVVIPATAMAAPAAPEIAARLDGLIERLRGALAARPG